MGVVLGGKSSNLSGYSSTTSQSRSCLIESRYINEIEFRSQGNIIIENVVADGYLINLVEGNSKKKSNLTFDAQGDLIFRNIKSLSDMIRIGSYGISAVLKSSGVTEFKNIQSSQYLIWLASSSNLVLQSENFINFQDIGGHSFRQLNSLIIFYWYDSNVSISAKGSINFLNISGIKGSTTGSPGSYLFNFDSSNLKLEMLSQSGVKINRPGNQPDYTTYPNNTMILEWVYPSSGKLLPCLRNCQKCTNGVYCDQCKPGTQLSSDSTQCILNFNSAQKFLEANQTKISIEE